MQKYIQMYFLPTGVNYVVMVNGAVAQPVMTNIYSPAKIELSDAIGFGLFAYKGTQAVMEDLIFYNGTPTTTKCIIRKGRHFMEIPNF